MNRPLHIDFDFYTDGDHIFKVEFVTLLISNLVELQQDLIKAIENNDPSIFQVTSHKIKPSLSILNDSEFTMVVENIHHAPFDSEKCKSFKQISDDIITSLEHELIATS